MQRKVRWKLIDNQDVVIDKEVIVEINDMKYIYYDDGKHVIDLKNKTYEREIDSFSFRVDFQNNVATFKLESGEVLEVDVKTNYKYTSDFIELRYKLDMDEKIIQMEMVEK